MRKLVIIPTYNEIENIDSIVRAVFNLEGGFNLLIIDDNSPDGTAEVIKCLQKEFGNKLFLIERCGKLGLGAAYITGFKWALEHNYDYIFEMDADFSHNPADLNRLYNKAVEENAGLVIGSRYVCGVNVVNWPMKRVLMSYFASYYVRIITGMPVKDATAGFVCYSKEALHKLNLDGIKMKGYGFQIEMKYSIWKTGTKICEVPIIFTDRTLGTSKMNSGIFDEAFWGVIGLGLRKNKVDSN